MIESGGVLALVFSPDGNTLFWSSDTGSVGDIDREIMIIMNTISVSTGENVLNLAVSPDGNTLAAGDESGTILFYNTSDFSAESETVAHGDAILSLRYSADGSTLYSAGMDASIRKWRVEGMEMIREIISHEATITAFCLLPGEINLLFSDHENQLILYSQADEKSCGLWNSHRIRFIPLMSVRTVHCLLRQEQKRKPGFALPGMVRFFANSPLSRMISR